MPLHRLEPDPRLALTLVARGDLEEAERMTAAALAGQVPHSLFEARLAQAEVLVARGAVGAAPVVRRSLAVAAQEGHLASARRLTELAAACRHVP